MKLTPYLESIEDLFGKLEREWQRAWNAEEAIDQADHFYNFCVTAHSMKDYFFEHKEIIEDEEKDPHRKEWNKEPYLRAATEIANGSKHFKLRDRRTGKLKKKAKTKVKPTARESTVFHVDASDEQVDFREESVTRPDLIIELENGEEWSLWDFKSEVIAYWVKYLKCHSIDV